MVYTELKSLVCFLHQQAKHIFPSDCCCYIYIFPFIRSFILVWPHDVTYISVGASLLFQFGSVRAGALACISLSKGKYACEKETTCVCTVSAECGIAECCCCRFPFVVLTVENRANENHLCKWSIEYKIKIYGKRITRLLAIIYLLNVHEFSLKCDFIEHEPVRDERRFIFLMKF